MPGRRRGGKKMEKELLEKIVELIYKSGFSVKRLSKDSGVSQSAIKSWLSGSRTPTVDNAQYVLSVLGYTIIVASINEAKIHE